MGKISQEHRVYESVDDSDAPKVRTLGVVSSNCQVPTVFQPVGQFKSVIEFSLLVKSYRLAPNIEGRG